MAWRLNSKKNPIYVAIAGDDDASENQNISYQQITDLTSPVSLNPPDGATIATIIPEGAGVRMRRDGTDPTAMVGMPVPLGVGVKLQGSEIASARFIGVNAGAILNIEYGR